MHFKLSSSPYRKVELFDKLWFAHGFLHGNLIIFSHCQPAASQNVITHLDALLVPFRVDPGVVQRVQLFIGQACCRALYPEGAS